MDPQAQEDERVQENDERCPYESRANGGWREKEKPKQVSCDSDNRNWHYPQPTALEGHRQGHNGHDEIDAVDTTLERRIVKLKGDSLNGPRQPLIHQHGPDNRADSRYG